MANPGDTGTFDLWITGRISFATAPPRVDNTGTFDLWLTDRISWEDYVATAVVDITVAVNTLTLAGSAETITVVPGPAIAVVNTVPLA